MSMTESVPEHRARFKIDVNPYHVSMTHWPYATFEKKVRTIKTGFLLPAWREETYWDFIASHRTYEEARQSLEAPSDSRLPTYL